MASVRRTFGLRSTKMISTRSMSAIGGLLLQKTTKSIGGGDQFPGDSGFTRRVSGVRNDDVFGFRPRLMQVVGGSNRANHVVAALNNRARQVTNPSYVREQCIVLQEHSMDEVVRFDASNGQRNRCFVEVRYQLGVGQQRRARAFVATPPMRGGHVHRRVGIGQPPVVAAQKVLSLALRKEFGEGAPRLGE